MIVMEGCQRKRRNSYRKPGIHFSYKQAKRLTTTHHSCVIEVPHVMNLTMSPKFVPNIREGLKETLDKFLLMYDKQLRGVPLAYDHIKIVSSMVIDDLEVFKMVIKLTFLVFRPEPGKLLNGIVNKITDSHFGCIIHTCINASIRQPERRVLSEAQKETIDNITNGDMITFRIWKFDVHHGIVIVLGDIYSECYQRIRRFSQSCSENENPETVVTERTDKQVEPETSQPKKKKKKIRSEETEMSSQDSEASPMKKKKKKKKALNDHVKQEVL